MSVRARAASMAVIVSAVAAHRSQAQAGFGYGSFWERPIHAGVDVGASFPTGQFSDAFDPGWNVGGNLAWPVNSRGDIWLQADFNFASGLVNGATLNAYDATDGGATITSGTLNVVFNGRDYWGGVSPYLLAGGGAYWRYVELDDYAGAVAYCSPFFGYCGVVGVAVPVVTRTQLAPGWDVGAGLRFRLPPLRLFLEARYNSAYTHHGNTTYLPVVFGIEW